MVYNLKKGVFIMVNEKVKSFLIKNNLGDRPTEHGLTTDTVEYATMNGFYIKDL